MFVFARETRRTTFLLIHFDKVYENAVFQFRFSWWTTVKERSTGAYKNYCGAALLNISASINCSTFVNILYARCVVFLGTLVGCCVWATSSVHWGEGGREIHGSETFGWIANISGVLLANSYEPCIFAGIRWASVTAWRLGAILCVLALSWEFPWFKEMKFLPCSLPYLYFEPNASALLITRKENLRWRTWHSTMIG